MNAIGVHVFAGHMTLGFQRHFDVIAQLERFTLGNKTARHNCKLPVHQRDDPREWPTLTGEVDVVYCNPRCTGFSGLNPRGGSTSPICRDIYELMA